MMVLAYHHRRAAHGQHRCCWCGDAIAQGERYSDLRVADCGTVTTQRQHDRCLDLVNRYGAHFGCYDDEPIDWPDVLEWAVETGGAA